MLAAVTGCAPSEEEGDGAAPADVGRQATDGPAGSDSADASGPADSRGASDTGRADTGGGSAGSPWSTTTCPPFRIITPALCNDPVTSCICDPTPLTCASGHLCLGGACVPPGQRRPEECEPDRIPASVELDPGAADLGVTTVTGTVNVEREEGGWALILPVPYAGQRPPVVRVSGNVEPPLADGAEVEAVTCVVQPSPGLEPRTALLRKDGEIVLLVAVDATYVRNDACIPAGWFPELLDVNCPPVWDGDDPDRACRVCRPGALAFPGSRHHVVSHRSELVTLGGVRYRALAGDGPSDCIRTCCGEDGRRADLPAAVEFALVSLDG